jgi:hypothetical protein
MEPGTHGDTEIMIKHLTDIFRVQPIYVRREESNMTGKIIGAVYRNACDPRKAISESLEKPHFSLMDSTHGLPFQKANALGKTDDAQEVMGADFQPVRKGGSVKPAPVMRRLRTSIDLPALWCILH